MNRGIPVLTTLVLTVAAMAQPQMPAPVLARIKDSTVYVKSSTDSVSVAGSGFLFERQGRMGVIVTNAHVVALTSGVGDQVEVVFASGTAAERRMPATVVALDKHRDLSLLRVTADKLPIPLNRMRSTGLTETLAVYVVGFPFGEGLAAKQGNPEVTLTAGTISSFRKDDLGNLAAIQVSGGVNPGNSGGPIVDAKGDLIGIAVAMVSGTQIGLAIPAESLSQMLLGRVSGSNTSQKAGGKDIVEIQFEVQLIDPMKAIQRVSILDALRSAQAEGTRPREDGRYGPLLNARELALKIDDQVATGSLKFTVKAGESVDYLHQIKYVRRNRETLYTQPGDLRVGQLSPASPARPGVPSIPGRPGPVDPRFGRPSEPQKPLIEDVGPPTKPVETAPAAEDTVTKLAAPIEDLAVAGTGRYLVCKLKDIPGLTIYDSYQAKIARTLRLPSPQFLFAAGGDRAIVYLKDENLVQTWELSTGEKLKTKPNPYPQSIGTLLMGYGRGDQALVLSGDRSSYSTQITLLNLDTLQPLPSSNTGRSSDLSSAEGTRLRANHDLSRVGATRTGVSPSGLIVMRRSGNGYDVKYEHTSEGLPLAGDDGRLYTSSGHIYTSDLVSVGEIKGNQLIPALGGGFVMAVDSEGRMTIYEAGKTNPLTPWGQFPDWPERSSRSISRPRSSLEGLSLDRRVIFAPNLGRIMLIPLEADSIILKAFKLKATLDKAGIDYVVVTSTPPTDVKPNQQWQYQLEAISKAGGIKYGIELGPPGMTISDTGLITWKIPARLQEGGEKVVVLVTDKSGEQAYHTFTLQMTSRTTGTGLTR